MVSIDCMLKIRIEEWYCSTSPDRDSLLASDILASNDCLLLMARVQKAADLFSRLQIANKDNLLSYSKDLTRRFEKDLIHFFDSITNSIKIKVAEFSQSQKGKPAGASPDLASKPALSMEAECDLLVAGTMVCILQQWEAPLIAWRTRDLRKACKVFLKLFAGNWVGLVDAMNVQTAGNNILQMSSLLHSERLSQSDGFAFQWAFLGQTDFYSHPARWLLKEWVLNAKQLILRYS